MTSVSVLAHLYCALLNHPTPPPPQCQEVSSSLSGTTSRCLSGGWSSHSLTECDSCGTEEKLTVVDMTKGASESCIFFFSFLFLLPGYCWRHKQSHSVQLSLIDRQMLTKIERGCHLWRNLTEQYSVKEHFPQEYPQIVLYKYSRLYMFYLIIYNLLWQWWHTQTSPQHVSHIQWLNVMIE